MKRVLVVTVAAGTLAIVVPSEANANDVNPVCRATSGTPVACDTWHNFPVTLKWTWSPSGELNTSGCETYTPAGDTPPSGEPRTCTVVWPGPQGAFATATLRIDTVLPAMTGAVPDRLPDANGWYNHPVQFSFQGADATSGIAGCERLTYGGPDDGSAKLTGRCSDKAGNSATFTASLSYDATAPALANVRADPGDREVTLSWTAPADTTSVSVTRSERSAPEQVPVAKISAASGPAVAVDRRLRNGRHYTYALVAQDRAGNVATTSVVARPHAVVLGSGRVRRVLSPPKLTWRKARHARYYNVQLYRGDHRILSRWPHGAKLQLRHSWRYRGKARRLARGSYHWYVWPGYGKRSAGRYGRLIARGSFRVTR